MTPILSIVIASHNDNSELIETVRSISATTPLDAYEIVIVDDASTPAVTFHTSSRIIRNHVRIGCGPSRFVGAMHAKGAWLLFTDSHMRFTPGWFDEFVNHARGDFPLSTRTVFCGSCLGLDAKNMDVTKAKPYFGATWNFYGPDRVKGQPMQVFECIWADENPNDFYRIPAMMGACYFIGRNHFTEMQGLRFLRSWGADEQELSLKTYLTGGQIVFLKKVRIGHKFKAGGLNKIKPSEPIYNKLFVMHTCLPREYAARLQKKMPRGGALTMALNKLHEDWHLVETARAHNQTIFTRDFDSFLKEFGLSFPAE